jgi:hypothetical protein
MGAADYNRGDSDRIWHGRGARLTPAWLRAFYLRGKHRLRMALIFLELAMGRR